MNSRIYCFNLTGERLNRMRAVGKKLRIEIVPCGPEKQQMMILLLSIQARQTALNPLIMPFEEEMLLLNGFSEQQIDLFLTEWRKGGCAPVRLKAVVTPTNSMWTVRQLYDQIKAEAAEMKG